MRPIRLEVQGLTAYRQKVEVDFRELDLFAITGPTGAGKSSLIDAMTYALFGQVPRVGRSVRELISHGEDKLRVTLEFSANGDTYRIFRESNRKTSKAPQLERFDPEVNDWRSEEVDRVKDTNEFIERLLRMDYEAFIRSVLLPQGEFQEFLAGDRDQRRRVLDGLLQLGVYGRMGQMANAMAARNNDRAAEIARRLQTELADATPEALKTAKADLKTLEAEAKDVAAARAALDGATRAAETLAQSLDKERSATQRKTGAEKRLAEAQNATKEGEAKAASLKTAIDEVRKKMDANTYDEAEFLRYRDAHNHAQELGKDEAALADVEKNGAALASQVEAASEAAKKVAQTRETAATAADDASQALVDARRVNAAEALRQKMKPGDACPVCGQTAHDIPHEKVPKLDEAKQAEARAKEAAEAARRAAEAAERTLAQMQTRLDGFTENRANAAARVESRRAALTTALGGKAATPQEIAAALKALEAAKGERDRLARDLETATKSLHDLNESMARATADLANLRAEITAAEREAAEAADGATKSAATLRETAGKADWQDVIDALDGRGDAPRILRSRLADAQSRERDLNQAVGAQKTRIEVIAANIEKAKELQAEERSLKEEGSLARDLASLLRADAFPTFIRESALKTLARVGSERLLEISGGRYDFVVEGQDFLVEDRWNGSEKRSVKTLSGGETFLASLALALALAEQLPGLSGDGATGSLESLFIDEGFSHLDNETLNVVASALEVLGQDRSRLIGVITHVPALAERMPSRITVHKTQAGSSVSVD
ncbi:MAG TPA: SMC family ATPase [Dehalococcoidia bacterium]|nr:SMC family ATPase [Dehalococcoidia bacterium]